MASRASRRRCRGYRSAERSRGRRDRDVEDIRLPPTSCGSPRLRSTPRLELVPELEVEGKLDDGLEDDGVDHAVEAIGAQGVEVKRPALARRLDGRPRAVRAARGGLGLAGDAESRDELVGLDVHQDACAIVARIGGEILVPPS